MKRLIFIFPIIAGILWGSVGVFVRTLSAFGVNNYTILSSKAMIAAILLFIGILIYNKSLLRIKLRDIWLFAAAGILGTLGLNLCYNAAVKQLTLSLSAVLLSLSPVFVVFLAALLFKEKITLRKTGCMILAIIGCMLTSGILERASGMKWTVPGILIGVLSAFFYALYSIFSKLAMAREYQALTITFYSFVCVSIILLPFTDWNILGKYVTAAPLENSLILLFHSICTCVLSYVLFTISLVYIEAGKASILASTEPVAAMVFGILFFAETPTVLSFTGLVITVIALTLLCMPGRERQPSS